MGSLREDVVIGLLLDHLPIGDGDGLAVELLEPGESVGREAEGEKGGVGLDVDLVGAPDRLQAPQCDVFLVAEAQPYDVQHLYRLLLALALLLSENKRRDLSSGGLDLWGFKGFDL